MPFRSAPWHDAQLAPNSVLPASIAIMFASGFLGMSLVATAVSLLRSGPASGALVAVVWDWPQAAAARQTPRTAEIRVKLRSIIATPQEKRPHYHIFMNAKQFQRHGRHWLYAVVRLTPRGVTAR